MWINSRVMIEIIEPGMKGREWVESKAQSHSIADGFPKPAADGLPATGDAL
jgi:hypothetical protein